MHHFDKFTREGAEDYNDIAMNIFKPIFPHIANVILEKFGITRGNCLDLGTGPAPLAIALARITSLRICALDYSPEILEFAGQNIAGENMDDRIIPLTGDVHHLPFADQTMDLIVSRGSFPNWEPKSSFQEIHRVLKKGGVAYIGAGLGSAEMAERIGRELKKRAGERPRRGPQRFNDESIAKLRQKLSAITDNVLIKRDDAGLWITMTKSL